MKFEPSYYTEFFNQIPVACRGRGVPLNSDCQVFPKPQNFSKGAFGANLTNFEGGNASGQNLRTFRSKFMKIEGSTKLHPQNIFHKSKYYDVRSIKKNYGFCSMFELHVYEICKPMAENLRREQDKNCY